MNEVFYFLPDGTYGLWEEGSVLTPTDYWSEQDWNAVEKSTNTERNNVVREICERRIKEMKGII